MQQFDWTNPWFIGVCAGLIGFALGVAVMLIAQRRQTGGVSVEQLRSEMSDYRENVSEHFEKTSELFQDLNEKYRDVYNHLASGSQSLCEFPMEHSRLEFAAHKTLDADSAEQPESAASTSAGSSVTPESDTVADARSS